MEKEERIKKWESMIVAHAERQLELGHKLWEYPKTVSFKKFLEYRINNRDKQDRLIDDLVFAYTSPTKIRDGLIDTGDFIPIFGLEKKFYSEFNIDSRYILYHTATKTPIKIKYGDIPKKFTDSLVKNIVDPIKKELGISHSLENPLGFSFKMEENRDKIEGLWKKIKEPNEGMIQIDYINSNPIPLPLPGVSLDSYLDQMSDKIDLNTSLEGSLEGILKFGLQQKVELMSIDDVTMKVNGNMKKISVYPWYIPTIKKRK